MVWIAFDNTTVNPENIECLQTSSAVKSSNGFTIHYSSIHHLLTTKQLFKPPNLKPLKPFKLLKLLKPLKPHEPRTR